MVDLRARRSESPFADRWATAGVAILGAGVAEVAREVDPAPGHELEHLADWLLRGGGPVRPQRVADWWRLGHDADALLEGNGFALEGITADYGKREPQPHEHPGTRGGPPERRESSRASSAGRRSSAPGARVTHSYVGPYTSIGRDVVVEGWRWSTRSSSPERASSTSPSRLEASVIGAGARVSRESRLPRALRVTVGDGAEVSLACPLGTSGPDGVSNAGRFTNAPRSVAKRLGAYTPVQS